MNDIIKEIIFSFEKLEKILFSDNEKYLNESAPGESESIQYSEGRICIMMTIGIIINTNSSVSEEKELIIAKYDNDNICIRIDGSKNHKRPHVHIDIKTDKHSVSIAIDNGEILNNSSNIKKWKINKIIQWIADNKTILEKMYRCINHWSDSKSAEKRKNKLKDFDK